MHLIIEELNVRRFKPAPKVLARNSEKFRTLTLGKFKIQDSLEHISASLDALVQDLNQTSNFSFPILYQIERFKKIPARQKSKALKLLKRKGVFCYEHFQSLQEMKKSQNLPPKVAFYSELNEEHITEADCSHAQEVFKSFKCKNVVDYMMLYCSLDVILLCEAFLQYRKMVMEHFQLDLVYYLGKFYSLLQDVLQY